MYKILILTFGFIFSQDYPILGSPWMLDVMTWNLRSYSTHGETNSYLIDIIDEIGVDIIAFQEIDSLSDFNSLIDELDGDWVGFRTYEHPYNLELAYAIDTEEIDVISTYNILYSNSYWFGGRPPYVLEFSHGGSDYVMINNHFKAFHSGYGLDYGNDQNEEYMRLVASQLLQEYVEDNYNLEKVIILGDLNDSITDDEANNVFWGFIQSDAFQFADSLIAVGQSSDWSYPTWPTSHIDHIIITESIYPLFNVENVETFKVDDYMDGGWETYETVISDHRPVFMAIGIDDIIPGDMNGDSFLDILDIITIVNLILSGQYNQIGDINLDGVLNVMDVVILANSILNPLQ